jgi:hypothetical protein
MLHIASDWTSLITSNALGFFIFSILPAWLFGLLTGLLAPRQPVLSDARAFVSTAAIGAVSLGTRSTLLSQMLMFFNGVIFVQTLWYRWTDPGTFHRLCAIAARAVGVPLGTETDVDDRASVQLDKRRTSSWYVDENDLKFFRARAETSTAPNAGAWETLVDKQIPGVLKYHARRRALKDVKKTEYLSTSVTSDSTPHEVCSTGFILTAAFSYVPAMLPWMRPSRRSCSWALPYQNVFF